MIGGGILRPRRSPLPATAAAAVVVLTVLLTTLPADPIRAETASFFDRVNLRLLPTVLDGQHSAHLTDGAGATSTLSALVEVQLANSEGSSTAHVPLCADDLANEWLHAVASVVCLNMGFELLLDAGRHVLPSRQVALGLLCPPGGYTSDPTNCLQQTRKFCQSQLLVVCATRPKVVRPNEHVASTNPDVYFPVLADLDQDGDVDMLHMLSTNNNMVARLNMDGRGLLGPELVVLNAPVSYFIAVDLDPASDKIGYPDLVLLHETQIGSTPILSLAVALCALRGTFPGASTSPDLTYAAPVTIFSPQDVDSSVMHMDTADMNADGSSDVVFATKGNDVLILFNDGSGAFQRSTPYLAYRNPIPSIYSAFRPQLLINTGHLSVEDPYPDILVTNALRTAEIVPIVWSSPQGRYVLAPPLAMDGMFSSNKRRVGNVVAGSTADDVVLVANSKIFVFRNYGNATFERIEATPATPYIPKAAELVDWNLDGILDIVFLSGYFDNGIFLLESSNPTSPLPDHQQGRYFSDPIMLVPSRQANAPKPVLVPGDLSGDGAVDLLFLVGSDRLTLGVRWLENSWFSSNLDSLATLNPDKTEDAKIVAACDMDGNGVSDVVALFASLTPIRVYLNSDLVGLSPAADSRLVWPLANFSNPADVACRDLGFEGFDTAVVVSPDWPILLVIRPSFSPSPSASNGRTLTNLQTWQHSIPQAVGELPAKPTAVALVDLVGTFAATPDHFPELVVSLAGVDSLVFFVNLGGYFNTSIYRTIASANSHLRYFTANALTMARTAAGTEELVVAAFTDGKVLVVRNTADTADALTTELVPTGSFYPYRVTAVDLNNDGSDDLVASHYANNAVTISLRQSAANTTTPHPDTFFTTYILAYVPGPVGAVAVRPSGTQGTQGTCPDLVVATYMDGLFVLQCDAAFPTTSVPARYASTHAFVFPPSVAPQTRYTVSLALTSGRSLSAGGDSGIVLASRKNALFHLSISDHHSRSVANARPDPFTTTNSAFLSKSAVFLIDVDGDGLSDLVSVGYIFHVFPRSSNTSQVYPVVTWQKNVNGTIAPLALTSSILNTDFVELAASLNHTSVPLEVTVLAVQRMELDRDPTTVELVLTTSAGVFLVRLEVAPLGFQPDLSHAAPVWGLGIAPFVRLVPTAPLITIAARALDFNGDSLPDLVLASSQIALHQVSRYLETAHNSTVQLFLSSADDQQPYSHQPERNLPHPSTPFPHHPTPVEWHLPGSLAVVTTGFINGDALPDIVVSCWQPSESLTRFFVLYNKALAPDPADNIPPFAAHSPVTVHEAYFPVYSLVSAQLDKVTGAPTPERTRNHAHRVDPDEIIFMSYAGQLFVVHDMFRGQEDPSLSAPDVGAAANSTGDAKPPKQEFRSRIVGAGDKRSTSVLQVKDVTGDLLPDILFSTRATDSLRVLEQRSLPTAGNAVPFSFKDPVLLVPKLSQISAFDVDDLDPSNGGLEVALVDWSGDTTVVSLYARYATSPALLTALRKLEEELYQNLVSEHPVLPTPWKVINCADSACLADGSAGALNSNATSTPPTLTGEDCGQCHRFPNCKELRVGPVLTACGTCFNPYNANSGGHCTLDNVFTSPSLPLQATQAQTPSSVAATGTRAVAITSQSDQVVELRQFSSAYASTAAIPSASSALESSVRFEFALPYFTIPCHNISGWAPSMSAPPDLLVAYFEVEDKAVWIPGNATTQWQPRFPIAPITSDLITARQVFCFAEPGRAADLLVLRQGQLVRMYNDGRGNFSTLPDQQSILTPRGLCDQAVTLSVKDLHNGDSALDIVLVCRPSTFSQTTLTFLSVFVLLSDASATPTAHSLVQISPSPVTPLSFREPGLVLIDDFDADGKVDLVYVSMDTLMMFPNLRFDAVTPRPSAVPWLVLPTILWAHRLPAARNDYSIHAVADFDQDGDLDIILAGLLRPLIYVLNEGGGRMTLSLGGNGELVSLGDMAAVDVDADGDTDLVVATQTELRVFLSAAVDSKAPTVVCPGSRSAILAPGAAVAEVTITGLEFYDDTALREASMRLLPLYNSSLGEMRRHPPSLTQAIDLLARVSDSALPAAAAPTFSLPPGRHVLQLSAQDLTGLRSSCEVAVDVVDLEPPQIRRCPEPVVRLTAANDTAEASADTFVRALDAVDNSGRLAETSIFLELQLPVFNTSSNRSELTMQPLALPGANYSLALALGTYRVRVVVADHSGNEAECWSHVSVVERLVSRVAGFVGTRLSVPLARLPAAQAGDERSRVSFALLNTEPLGLSLFVQDGLYLLSGIPLLAGNNSLELMACDLAGDSTSAAAVGDVRCAAFRVEVDIRDFAVAWTGARVHVGEASDFAASGGELVSFGGSGGGGGGRRRRRQQQLFQIERLPNPAVKMYLATDVRVQPMAVQIGGSPCATYEVVAGKLPKGVAMDPETGVFSGRPVETGTFAVQLLLVDSSGVTAAVQFGDGSSGSDGGGLPAATMELAVHDCFGNVSCSGGVCLDNNNTQDGVFSCRCDGLPRKGARCNEPLVCSPGHELRTTDFSCQPCPPGSVDDDLNGNTPCAPCPPGSSVPSPGSVGLCAAHVCPEGSVDDDLSPTTPCKTCPAGHYTLAGTTGPCNASTACPPGSTDHDSDPATPCLSCGSGFFVPGGSFGPCAKFICPGGETDDDDNASTDCVSCGVGHFTRPGASGPCIVHRCDFGTIDHDSDPTTGCKAVCTAGHFVSPQASGSCEKYLCQAGTTDHDLDTTTECVACGPGTFVEVGFSGTCASHNCSVGTIDHDSDPKTECVACPEGTYVPRGQTGSCADFACPDGLVDGDGNPKTPCVAQAASQAEGAGQSKALLAGVAGGAGLLVLLLLGVLLVIRRRRRREKALREKEMADMKQRVVQTVQSLVPGGGQALSAKMKRLELPRNMLDMGEKLGEGEFGDVVKAKLNSGEAVAVKQVKAGVELDQQERFLVEAWLTACLEHPNIVRVYAICSTDVPFLVALEYLPGGNLRDYLRASGPAVHQRVTSRSSLPAAGEDNGWEGNAPQGTSLQALVAASVRLAGALAYLEDKKVIHRDLAARNVLVGRTLSEIKLADFGMSRAMEEKDYYRKTSDDKVPVKWMAPESIQKKVYSHKTDVWSFGVLLWEMFSFGAPPFAELTAVETALAVGTGKRLERPELCPPPIFGVMKPCWHRDASSRPSFADLESRLQGIAKGFGVVVQTVAGSSDAMGEGREDANADGQSFAAWAARGSALGVSSSGAGTGRGGQGYLEEYELNSLRKGRRSTGGTPVGKVSRLSTNSLQAVEQARRQSEAEREEANVMANLQTVRSRSESEALLAHAQAGTFVVRRATTEDCEVEMAAGLPDIDVRHPATHVLSVREGRAGGSAGAGGDGIGHYLLEEKSEGGRVVLHLGPTLQLEAASLMALIGQLKSGQNEGEGQDIDELGAVGGRNGGQQQRPRLVRAAPRVTSIRQSVGGLEGSSAVDYVDLENGAANIDFAAGPLMRFAFEEGDEEEEEEGVAESRSVGAVRLDLNVDPDLICVPGAVPLESGDLDV